jgi:hypothetical protein
VGKIRGEKQTKNENTPTPVGAFVVVSTGVSPGVRPGVRLGCIWEI